MTLVLGPSLLHCAVPPRPHPHDQCHFVLLSVCEPLIRLGLLVANPCIHHLTDYHLLHPFSFISTSLFLDLLLENACTESPKDQESKTLAKRLATPHSGYQAISPEPCTIHLHRVTGLVTSPRSTSFSTSLPVTTRREEADNDPSGQAAPLFATCFLNVCGYARTL